LIVKQTVLLKYIMLESVPGTNQYSALRVNCLAKGNNESL